MPTSNSFCLYGNIFISPVFLKDNFAGYIFVWLFFFHLIKYFISLSSDFHCFWWESNYKSYRSSLDHDMQFSSCCFQIFVFVFGFQHVHYNECWCEFVYLFYLEFIELIRCIDWSFSSNLGSFHPSFFNVFWPFLFCLSFWCPYFFEAQFIIIRSFPSVLQIA